MSTELTPLQLLAITRSLLAHALRDPVWLMLLQRCLKEKPLS
jgi:hypothetical protein